MAYLTLQGRSKSPAPAGAGREPFVSNYTVIGGALFPRRSLLCALLLHLAFLWFVATWPIRYPLFPAAGAQEEYDLLADILPDLPPPGGEIVSGAGDALVAAHNRSEQVTASRSHAKTPFTPFAGSQTIVSTPAKPTNAVQTILEPDLAAPPLLDPLILSPNLVELAAPRLFFPPAPASPESSDSQEGASPVANVSFPIETNRRSSLLFSPPPGQSGGQNLVVLSPAPAPIAPVPFPTGEAQGQFAISRPQDSFALPSGAPITDGSAEQTTTGNRTNGADLSARAGTIPGITIQGGEWENDSGPARQLSQSAPQTQQNRLAPPSYGLTIVSTGNSGGAVGDFGVFSDEPVFTVYIDIQGPERRPLPSWALQYAVMGAAPGPGDVVNPPYPDHEELPHWPTDLAERHRGDLLVVSAEINEDGHVLNARILQSPAAELSKAIADTLEKWTFRPATLRGQSVPVKALLGVPVVPNE
jgi:TonB family protein